jgi:DNA-directed RNA polymerase I, II, and III subunit RPABC2
MSSTPEVLEEAKSQDGSSDGSEVESEVSATSVDSKPAVESVDEVSQEKKNIKEASPLPELSPSGVIAAVVSEDGGEATDTDTDEDDDDMYQKLEADINSSLLSEKHPGITQSSYSEILTLTKVIRNDKGEIIDDLHKTYPFVTKYERAKIIGVRTKQLNHGADPFIEVPPDMIDGYSIALKEMEAKKLPFIISRPLPNGASEYWRLSDLEMVHF